MTATSRDIVEARVPSQVLKKKPGQSTKVADELGAVTLFALGPDGVVDGVGVFAAAAKRPPLVDVEPLAPDQKVLANLLRAAPHKAEVLALAGIFAARVFAITTVLQLFQLMFGVQMVTKAPIKLRTFRFQTGNL